MNSNLNIEFEKFHGASNDFIFIADSYLNLFSNQNDLKKFSKIICHRNKGIGADGIVFYQYQQNNNVSLVRILILNSDGSFAATCGNALRCLGLKLIQDKIWDGINQLPIFRLCPQFIFDNLNTISYDEKFITLKDSFAVLIKAEIQSYYYAKISVAMGKELEIKKTPLEENSLVTFGDFKNMTPIFVSLANPHWVFISSEFQKFNRKKYEEFGYFAQNELRNKSIENNIPIANIGMISFHGKNTNQWNLVVYERGAGLTECCGSGGVAARIALEYSQNIDSINDEVYFQMPGGLISISKLTKINEFGEQRILSGAAKKVFSGNIPHYLFR